MPLLPPEEGIGDNPPLTAPTSLEFWGRSLGRSRQSWQVKIPRTQFDTGLNLKRTHPNPSVDRIPVSPRLTARGTIGEMTGGDCLEVSTAIGGQDATRQQGHGYEFLSAEKREIGDTQ
ncbi:hypothetical protein ABZ621_34070 [Streptomyces sp. NPDC007863]|uniref:hypothetical protein n=1 Tax=Streptomyces sp. NPDC007863 TaxID=3154894 RepID=UPI0033EC74BE